MEGRLECGRQREKANHSRRRGKPMRHEGRSEARAEQRQPAS